MFIFKIFFFVGVKRMEARPVKQRNKFGSFNMSFFFLSSFSELLKWRFVIFKNAPLFAKWENYFEQLGIRNVKKILTFDITDMITCNKQCHKPTIIVKVRSHDHLYNARHVTGCKMPVEKKKKKKKIKEGKFLLSGRKRLFQSINRKFLYLETKHLL